MTSSTDPVSGHVGGPCCNFELRLEDIPDMGYTTRDLVDGWPCPRGEVLFRGSNIIPGYFRLPDRTAEAIDADGWLHTGDVA
jgi:long-chain acyl-CoA synthetase